MLKKQWGWDKYIRGTVAGHNIVKRKSRPKRQTLELGQNSVPGRLREDPLPSFQGQHNGGQENTSSSSQPFQNMADTQAARNTESPPLESNDIIDERTWPYIEGSPQWWREGKIDPYDGHVTSRWNYLGCFLLSPTSSGTVCNCPNFSSPWNRFRYFSLPEKLRLLKTFSIMSCMGEYHRTGYGKDMLRVLYTVLGTIEVYYGQYSVDTDSFGKGMRWSLDLIRRTQRRVERMGQLVLRYPARYPLDIIRLGHLSLTLVLPTLTFIFRGEEFIALIEKTASLFWCMLRVVGEGWRSSLRQQALEGGIGGHDHLNSLLDEIGQPQGGSFALHWDRYISLVLQTNLGLYENQRTDELRQSQTAFNLRQLGTEILSGQVPFGKLHLLVETSAHLFELGTGQSPSCSISLDAFVKLWPKDLQLEEPQSNPLELKIPLRRSPGGKPGARALVTTKFAETTKLLAGSCQKRGDPQIAVDIYYVFHRILVDVDTDLYIYALQTGPTSTILSSISMLLIEGNMRGEEVGFWGTHFDIVMGLHSPTWWFRGFSQRETKRDFITAFSILFKLSTQDPRINRHQEDNNRLRKRLTETWDCRVLEIPWPWYHESSLGLNHHNFLSPNDLVL
ncbi:hypothetical protein AOL_s00097g172 [Orbilia oligospora ATCC 24927]|uniref:Uncharacterized protein n=1 Tax=Arthrobotrys oligospora (strain ATCC 24927 / CBS 115.81 / DSM 1491) TaxID=756982 RepID=G1XIJ5_ARTOA|nr:hypothetical protein AOL_s00097g172 [Orbilia oligospora ATCC 24927]EGX47126.1 hypothetical protein AOL_s00097g172 [Orbilia oligospora ATCC 24927]